MPVTPTYPGVYVEELPSSVRTITAVSTSVTAFVGSASRGPVDTPVTLTSFADFERRFGGLAVGSVLGYAVQQFYVNGGSLAVVVRVAKGAGPAERAIRRGDTLVLTVVAKESGALGNGLRVAIDNDTPTPDATFNLTVAGAVTESHRDLSLNRDHPRYAPQVVNSSSALVEVVVAERADPAVLPDPSGTVSGSFGDPLPDLAKEITAKLEGTQTGYTFMLYTPADGAAPTSVPQLALLLERKLRAAAPGVPALAGARVRPVGRRLQVLAGTPDATVRFTNTGAGDLGLEGTARPATYLLQGGKDGNPPGLGEFLGSADRKTGLNALRDVDDVNLLCLPEVADLAIGDLVAVLAEAERLCRDKRMLLLVDPPASWTTLDAARANLTALDPVRSSYAAFYFPRIQMTDPLTGQLRAFPPSGAVAGIMARTDSDRGVWKAPAGTEARLAGVRALATTLTDPENGLLNPLAVNCLRSFPIIGPVVWGARTLDGADAAASQWKYVPVRRLALMIEESLYRGTKWVVFEPNDERLWGQIRLNVGAFMQTLFRQGAFQGTSAREAYFVKCDKDTTTQNDIDRGVVNILVGFAPLKPAEFVVIQIEQLAGQIEV
jgi:phage tail sheath protein FI